MKSNRKFSPGINIGSASMLLIFVILCLVSFAALSIVSAYADSRLTAKITDRTSAYYAACNSAQEALADMDCVLSAQYQAAGTEEAYFQAVGRSKSFSAPVSENQLLLVSVEILYPLSPEDTFYRITRWQLVTETNPSME